MRLISCPNLNLIFSCFFITSFSCHATAQNASSVYCVNLQSAEGKYLSATRKFEETVEAIVDDANTDELFIITDENGGNLQSGDAVRLYAHSGYITTDENGLLAATGKPDKSMLFKIIKASGEGTINPNDKIELQTPSGEFISAQDNGKMKAEKNASGKALLTISAGTNNAAIADAFAEHWNHGYNIGFDSSSQAQFGKELQDASNVASLIALGSKAENKTTANNTRPVKNTTAKPVQTITTNQTAPTASQKNSLPSALPRGYYKCYVDHVPNLALAGYFSLLPGNKYIYHGFDANKRTGITGTYTYDAATGKIEWASGAWKTNNYYGIYSLDKVYGDRIYLIPNGSDYSACKCFLQDN
jgi:hypothetical protein